MEELRLTDIKQLVHGHRLLPGGGQALNSKSVHPQILLGGDSGWLSWTLRHPHTRVLELRRL